MSSDLEAVAVDIGEFCRRVEEHLARVNQGQIIRLVGPAFEMARAWALDGIPLGIVAHGIDRKAERHRAGRSTRPLRLEFCEDDVRDVYTRWRRSVGLPGRAADSATDDPASGASDGGRRPSLSRHVDRALDKLSRVAGRLDLPDAFRDQVSQAIDRLSGIRDAARGARGETRQTLADQLPALDASLMAAARSAVGGDVIERLRGEASADLASYRGRLPSDVWERSVERAFDQLLRDHLGIPTLSFEP